MGELIVHDLENALIQRLAEESRARDRFFARAAALRAETAGTAQTDSAELICADRDRDSR